MLMTTSLCCRLTACLFLHIEGNKLYLRQKSDFYREECSVKEKFCVFHALCYHRQGFFQDFGRGGAKSDKME